MRSLLQFVALFAFAALAFAHEGHDEEIPAGSPVLVEPIDTILWIHIAVQILAWGIVFPTGMVLGIVKSRLHVPVQVLGIMLAIAGYYLGHAHKGRMFGRNIHSQFAHSVGWMLTAQAILGIYLKLHLENRIKFLARARWPIVLAHGIVGKTLPVVAWVQMLFGGIVAMGYCKEDHLGQCLAHFIMGSAFIGYGIMLLILLMVGQAWLRRTGRSQEFFDSLVIAAWGLVNSLTEHHWGHPWVGNDLQHTTMGVVWLCAGLLGVFLSRKRDGSPQRNLIPSLVIILTGWAMSGHAQHLMLSTMVHAVFGYTLMAAGGTRIIEIVFILKDAHGVSRRNPEASSSFQYLPPFLIVASGFLFMGATEEQMAWLSSLNVTHVSYILLLYSVAFLLFLFVCMLLQLYANYVWPISKTAAAIREPAPRSTNPRNKINGLGLLNGDSKRGYGMMSRDREAEKLKDLEEFELEGLMSEDEERASGSGSGSGSGSLSSNERRKEARLPL